MSVRKRTWTTGKGELREAWIVSYADAKSIRRQKTFARKADARAFSDATGTAVRAGTHVADRASVTVAQAGALWITTSEDHGLEASTVEGYRAHLDLHIIPFVGSTKLSALGIPAVRAFEDQLRQAGRSPAMVRKVRTSLGSIFSDAQERGLASTNPVRDMRARRKGGERRQEKRHRGRLKVGTDIPTPEEIKAIIAVLTGRWRPLLLTAIFAGLRASELRGLRWTDIDFERREVHVRQRADKFNRIGRPKSEAGERVVPLPPAVLNALREWKLACPKRATGKLDAEGRPVRELDLVFPNGNGNIEQLNNIVRRGLASAEIAAGVTVDTGKLDKKGRAVLAPKYPGLHSLRHFYASWCINRVADGGLGLPPKMVQERLGHTTITMLMDTYGHLFSRGDDGSEMAAAERALMG